MTCRSCRLCGVSSYSLGGWLAALARSTAPGLGYGRCWKRGPAAVVSAPVFASLRLGRPLDQEPLFKNTFVLMNTWVKKEVLSKPLITIQPINTAEWL